MVKRRKPNLSGLIRKTQIGFVGGHNILDNIFLAKESLAWDLESNHNLVLMLLDFEKAFDKIS